MSLKRRIVVVMIAAMTLGQINLPAQKAYAGTIEAGKIQDNVIGMVHKDKRVWNDLNLSDKSSVDKAITALQSYVDKIPEFQKELTDKKLAAENRKLLTEGKKLEAKLRLNGGKELQRDLPKAKPKFDKLIEHLKTLKQKLNKGNQIDGLIEAINFMEETLIPYVDSLLKDKAVILICEKIEFDLKGFKDKCNEGSAKGFILLAEIRFNKGLNTNQERRFVAIIKTTEDDLSWGQKRKAKKLKVRF